MTDAPIPGVTPPNWGQQLLDWIAVKSPVFPVEEHGAVGDGTTDDAAAIQAAVDAAAAAGGGTVRMGPFVHAWSGDLTIKQGVFLQGAAANGGTVSELKALDSTSRLRVGNWTGHGHPGGLARLRVNGDGTGSSEGLVYLECVATSFQDVVVTDATGPGVYLNAAQNSSFIGVDVSGCAVGFKLDNGSGGCAWLRCEIANNQIGVHFYDDPGMSNAYPFGSSHNTFYHCIVENYVDAQVAVLVDAGSNNFFQNCGISNNGQTLSDDALVLVQNALYPAISTEVVFTDCNFNGGGSPDTDRCDIIRIVGPNKVKVNGLTYIQETTRCFVQDTGVGILSLDGTFTYGPNVPGVKQNAINGGSLISWAVNKESTLSLMPPTTGTPAHVVKTYGDSGGRWYVLANGDMGWQNGTDFTTRAKFIYSAASARLSATGGIQLAGRYRRLAPAAVFPNGAISIDADAYSVHQFWMVGTGNISSMTVTGSPSEGDLLKLEFAFDSTGGQAITWATNMVFANGVAPADRTKSTWLTVEFKWDDTNDLWVETARAVRVPTDGATYPSGETAVYQYTSAQTDTALVIPVGAKYCRVRGASGGQGGGSGKRGPNGGARCGGGGGGGGGYMDEWFNVADLAVSTLYVTVGAGGTGGAAVTANNTNGNPGTKGGDSLVKTASGAATMANTIAQALSTSASSTVPGGGTASAGAGGVGGFGLKSGQNGGASGTAGGAGLSGGIVATSYCAGGGGGGGLDASGSPVASIGGGGGWVYGRAIIANTGGAVGSNGNPGGNGPNLAPGQGGAGGGAGVAAGGVGGTGGAGGYGAGGGGGGASLDGSNSGAGGAGGVGFVELVFYF